MKKITIKLLSILAVAVLLNGCGEADPILYDGEAFVSYTDGTMGDYFVQSDNAPYAITVGIPAPAGSDMTITLTEVYASGTAGTQFTLPSSVTIPAGDVTASFDVTGSFDDLAGRKDTLVIALSSDNVANFDNEYTVYLQQFCPFVLDEFIGAWTATEVSDFYGAYDPYTVNLAANPNGGDTLITSDIWPYLPVKITFDVSNPAKFQWSIPDQFLTADLYGYGEGRITSYSPGPMSSCDLALNTLRYKVYVAAGEFEVSSFSLLKD